MDGIDKVLYGPHVDRRQNLYTLTGEKGEKVRALASSVCCFISKSNLVHDTATDTYKIADHVPTLKKALKLRYNVKFGEDEHFRDEIAMGSATGFLVTDRMVLTAAHVVCRAGKNELDEDKIRSRYVVFGYLAEDGISCKREYSADQVFWAESVKFFEFSRKYTWKDYAFLKLNRVVPGRIPVTLNWNPIRTKVDEELSMIGYPLGLSCKYSDEGTIMNYKPTNYFELKIDADQGNSGSAVFLFGQVVGILCCGNTDIVVDNNYKGTGKKRCVANKIKPENIIEYELVQRISELDPSIKRYIKKWSTGFKLHSIPLPQTVKNPGLYIYRECLNESCTLVNQSLWFSRGLGKFHLDELRFNTPCPECKENIKVKDIGISGSCYRLKGLLLKLEKSEEINFKEKNRVLAGKLKTMLQPGEDAKIMWRYLKIKVYKLA